MLRAGTLPSFILNDVKIARTTPFSVRRMDTGPRIEQMNSQFSNCNAVTNDK